MCTQSTILELVLDSRARGVQLTHMCVHGCACNMQQYAAPPPSRLKVGFRATRKQLSYVPVPDEIGRDVTITELRVMGDLVDGMMFS